MAVLEIFILDSLLPHAATAAILYLVVVLLVARDKDRIQARSFAWLVTLLCVVAYFHKAHGAVEPWESLFNRALIVGSAWFIVLAMARPTMASSTIAVDLTAEEREALADMSDRAHKERAQSVRGQCT